VSGRCRVGVSRSTKRSGRPAFQQAGRVFVHMNAAARLGRALSARCVPAALMKEQCAGCPTGVLANASSQWDGLPHLVRLPFRHEATTGAADIFALSQARRLSPCAHPHASRMDAGETEGGEISHRNFTARFAAAGAVPL
jgi:hypothetical protein